MLTDDLLQLGLSREEAKIYLTVLELGGSFASTIASKAGTPRVNCYYVLENLRKKGLITANLKGNTKFFIAEPPQVLVNKTEENYQKAKSLLPDLLALTKASDYKPAMRSYEGLDGIKTIFEQMLTAKSEVIGYTNLKALGELLPDFLPGYFKKLVKNKVKLRLISPSSKEGREFTQNFFPKNFPRELVEILFVNPDEFSFENQIAIYDSSVSIVSLNPDEKIGVMLGSEVYARTQKAVFNLSWLGATAFAAQ